MKNLVEKFENFGVLHSFLRQNARIVIGLSGGSDSIALTLLFREVQKKYSLFLMAAHVNFHLRGEESMLDERFVKEFCFKCNIPLYILQAKITSVAGIQKEAREIRLEYFKKLKKGYKLDFIALGHQFEDQAETVLHRILRGAGFTGLSGICPIKDDIIHPILLFKKELLIEYLKSKGISYRTDQTNFTSNYTRNKIRNELLPQIEQDFNPNIEQKLVEYGNLFYLTENYFKQQAKKDFKRSLIEKNQSDIVFDISALKKVYPILKFYIFREAWSILTTSDKDFYSVHFQDILSAMESNSGYKEVVLPENVVVMKDYQYLIFRKIDKYQAPQNEQIKTLDAIRNVFSFNEYRFTMQKMKLLPEEMKGLICREGKSQPLPTPNDREQTESQNIAIFDLDKIVLPIKLHYRKDGDRFIPFGMKGFKKIKDFFIDEKVPLKERDFVVLFSDEEKIFWVSGYRIDQRVAVSPETKNFLSIKMERIEDMKNRAVSRMKS